MPHIAHGPVLIVGQGLDQNRGAAGAVAFVDRLFEVLTVGATGALRDGALDVVLGHIGLLGLVDDQAQSRIRIDIAAAHARRGLQLADQLREDLPALGVECTLLAFDRGPF